MGLAHMLFVHLAESKSFFLKRQPRADAFNLTNTNIGGMVKTGNPGSRSPQGGRKVRTLSSSTSALDIDYKIPIILSFSSISQKSIAEVGLDKQVQANSLPRQRERCEQKRPEAKAEGEPHPNVEGPIPP
jgi:hypothetical protein